MKNPIRKVLLGVALGAVAILGMSSSAAKADDYWRHHWNWYDNSYRPYHHHYYSSPGYYSRPSYGYGYTTPGYGGTYYYNQPGYAPGYYHGGQVGVGPMRFGWW